MYYFFVPETLVALSSVKRLLIILLLCGHSLLAGHHQVDGEEPLLQSLPRTLKGCVGCERVVMSAPVAYVDWASWKQMSLGAAAQMAFEAVRPLLVEQVLGTSLLSSESLHEVGKVLWKVFLDHLQTLVYPIEV